jgi:aldehyde dehydrogenase
MTYNEENVREIIRRVRRRFGETAPGVSSSGLPTASADLGNGVFSSVSAAVEAAQLAFQRFSDLGLERRREVIDSVRGSMRQHSSELARLAHEETGLGRTEDKVVKNLLVTDKTPGPEDLEPDATTGDQGMTVTEFAPFGVVAAITPTTNPTATIINNSLAIVSAGNGLVFNAHPNGKRVSALCVQLINQAIARVGGPANLVTTVENPTIASAQELMRNHRVRLLMVTGGPGVVAEALATDKRAITAGPGNPPVLVDETADIELAGREIVRGASFDNNMVCTDEKEIFVVGSKADDLLNALGRNRAIVLQEYQLRQLERVIFVEMGEPGRPGEIDRRWVGQNANRILAEIGITAGDDLRLIVAEVSREHSLVWTEQMMPVIPLVRVRNVEDGIDLAARAEHGFRHTASVYSNDVSVITRMARTMKSSIFVANSANLAGLGAGGEDYSSFSIATPTGEGLTRPRTFSRIRRLTVVGSMRIV